SELEKSRGLLVSIMDGYQALRQIAHKGWGELVAAMKAEEVESALLREAAPPLERGEWIVSGAANWIRHLVLKYPGILYDDLHAATQLGISISSFIEHEVQQFLAPAKYTGVFASHERRWWRRRLYRLASELSEVAGRDAPPYQAFAEAFRA